MSNRRRANANRTEWYKKDEVTKNLALGACTKNLIQEIHQVTHKHYFKNKPDNTPVQFTLMGPTHMMVPATGVIVNLSYLDELDDSKKPCLNSSKCFLENFYFIYSQDIVNNQSVFINESVGENRFRLFMDLDFKLNDNFKSRLDTEIPMRSQSVEMVSRSYDSSPINEDEEMQREVENVLKLPEEFKYIMLMCIHRCIGKLYNMHEIATPCPMKWHKLNKKHIKTRPETNIYDRFQAFFPRCPQFISDVESYWDEKIISVEREIEQLSDDDLKNKTRLKVYVDLLRDKKSDELDLAMNGSNQPDDDFKLGNMIVTESKGQRVFDQKKNKYYHKYGIHIHWKNIVVTKYIADLIIVLVIHELNNNTILNDTIKSLNLNLYEGKWNWYSILDSMVYKESGSNLRLIGSKKYNPHNVGTKNPHTTSSYLPTMVIRPDGRSDITAVELYNDKDKCFQMVTDCSIRVNYRQKWSSSFTPFFMEDKFLRDNPSISELTMIHRRDIVRKILGFSDDDMYSALNYGKMTKQVIDRNIQNGAAIGGVIRGSTKLNIDQTYINHFCDEFIRKIQITSDDVDELFRKKIQASKRMKVDYSTEFQRYNVIYNVVARVFSSFKQKKNTITTIYKTPSNCYLLFTNCRTCPNHIQDHSKKTIYFLVDSKQFVYLKCTCRCEHRVGISGSSCLNFKLFITQLDDYTYSSIENDDLKRIDRQSCNKVELKSIIISESRPCDMSYAEEQYLEQQKKKKHKKTK